MSGQKSLGLRVSRVGMLVLAVLVVIVGVRLAPTHPAFAASQPYTFHNVNTGAGGGFIPGVVFNPSRQNLMYVRTDIGGAYRWNQATGSWVQLLNFFGPDDWNLTGVDSIATDPVDPNRLVLAVGTYTNSFTTQNGAILRSTDQGNTFQRTDLPFKNGGNMPGRSMGERLAIDPNRDSIIYFGARSGNGLWRSTDFGATWSKVTSFTAPQTYVEKAGDIYLGDPDGVVWETFDKRTGSAGNATQTIYVGVADKGNSIYRSTDGGATWAAVPGQPTGFLPHHGVLSSTGQLYVTYSNGAGPFDGTSGDVWKLDTASGVWTKISPIPSTDTNNDYFGYGGLAVDTLHPNTLMVTALNSWWPDTIFFRSTDAGATWTRLWDFTSYPNRSLRYVQDISAAPWLDFGTPSSQAVPPVPSPKAGWMVGTMAIDPFNSNHMVYGTGATLYGTNDLTNWDAGTQFHISVAAKGIEEENVLALISPPTGAQLISGAGDVGGFRHDDVTLVPAKMFEQPAFSTTNSLDYAETTPNFIVRVGSNQTSGSSNAGFSFDGGSSWFQANNMPSGASGGTVAAAANASRVVWAPAQAAVSVSTDNGNSWTASTGIAQGAFVGADRVNPSKFYGLVSGQFLVSTNGGASFSASAQTGLPTSGKFKAVPGHEGEIWLAGGTGGLWHSTNSGATFTKLATVTSADTIGLGKAAPGSNVMAMFTSGIIGGLHAIFRSDDAGATWVRINDDQHGFGSTNADITGDPRIYGRVYFTTNGLGIVYGDIAGGPTPTPTTSSSPTPTTPPTSFSLSANPTSLSVINSASTTITITRAAGFTGSVAFSTSTLPAGLTASFNPTSTTGNSTTLTFANSGSTGGQTVVTVTGTSGSSSASTNVTVTTPVSDPVVTANPSSLTVTQGGSTTSTISTPAFGGATVTFATSTLPSGVTATFNPASITAGGTSTMTISATATAQTGADPVSFSVISTFRSSSGSTTTVSTPLTLRVNASTGGTGGVTVTPVVASSSPFFNEEDIKVANPAALTALSVTIVIQRTTGITFNGQFNTVGSHITQGNTSTTSTITYQFNLASGQTLGANTSGYTFAAQTSGSGTAHPTAGDTFTVTYTTGGQSFTQTGHF